MIIDTIENLQWRRLQVATCFIIWRERCRRIFREKEKTQLEVIREIIQEFRE
jgi:hypothetical protein